MGLSNILSVANSGLQVSQTSLELVARNVANADTPGYTAKSLNQQNNVADGVSLGVRPLDVTRTVDRFLQSQLRVETAAMNDVDVRNQFLQRIDQLFGKPGGTNSLDTILNNFTQSMQELTASPDSFANRQAVTGDAQTLAQQLRALSGDIQASRQMAEDSIATAVDEVNESLQHLSTINKTLRGRSAGGSPPADLLDERDKFIDQIAQFLEVRVRENEDGSVALFTRGGNSLLEGQPVTLNFDHRGDISTQSLYSTDDAERGVGTVTLEGANGFSIDLIGQGTLDSGRLGAYVELRDEILVEAQAQLDELAHGLALSLSSKQVDGTAATAGAASGFDIDTTGLQPGNAITLNYTATPPGTPQTVSIVRVDDPSQLPLPNEATPNPNDTVIGVDFSGGLASVASTLDTALGGAVSVSAPGGNTLRFLDDGAAGASDINSLSSTVTSTSVQDDGAQLPLFVDGSAAAAPYTGSFDDGGQKLGFASRIAVNQEVMQNNELLVRYASSPQTPLGDATRPTEMLERLTENTFAFSPASGIGQQQGPYSGTVTGFAERIISYQTGRAEQTAREKESQEVVMTALKDRFQSDTGVDVNAELSELITLQNAFAANARIIQAVDEMFQLLFRTA